MMALHLKNLRRECGWTRAKWASVSGINPATLYRWEKGETLPRDTELLTALKAIGASNAARKAAFYQLTEARRTAGIRAITPLAGVPVVRGDLLKALRVRCGLIQEEIATHLSIPRATVSHWERGDRFPDTATLHTLCALYKAFPDEIATLTTLPAEESFLETDPLAPERIDISTWAHDWRLVELHYLKQLAQLDTVSHPEVTRVEAQIRIDYAAYLLTCERTGAAKEELRRAAQNGGLHLDATLRLRAATLDAWAIWEKDTPRDHNRAINLLVETLAACDTADVSAQILPQSLVPFYQYRLQRTDVAKASGKTYLQLEPLVKRAEDRVIWERLRPKVLSNMGKYDDALNEIDAYDVTTGAMKTWQAISRVEVLTEAGSHREAQDAYQAAVVIGEEYGLLVSTS